MDKLKINADVGLQLKFYPLTYDMPTLYVCPFCSTISRIRKMLRIMFIHHGATILRRRTNRFSMVIHGAYRWDIISNI